MMEKYKSLFKNNGIVKNGNVQDEIWKILNITRRISKFFTNLKNGIII